MDTTPMQKKKKIVYGINNFYIGGAPYQLVRQLPYFNQEKYDITIVTLTKVGTRNEIRSKVPEGFPVYNVPFSGYFDAKAWIKLYRLMQEIRPDLVILSLYMSTAVFRLLRLVLWYPVISREHNTYVNKKRSHIFVDKLLSYITTKFIAVSEEVADFASKQASIPRGKFLVIHNGIDIDEIADKRSEVQTEEVRKQLGIKPHEKIALYVGRIIKQKNISLMIKGFVEFSRVHSEWKLIVVGGGGLEKEIKQLAFKRKMSKKIVFTGEQDNVHPYYMIADCFLSTSHVEGMSNTMLEALAHGVPILTTKTGGTGALVHEGENGFFIGEETPACVADALEQFAHADGSSMSMKARERVKEFDIKEIVRQYEGVFETYAK